MTKVVYGDTEDAWVDYGPFIKNLITENRLSAICDIGGGANPVVDMEFIGEHALEYHLLDISQPELEKAPVCYQKIHADIASTDFQAPKRFDLIFSKMLAEHIPNAEQFHKNVLHSLADDGLAVHFFPTLFTIPFLVNYLLPERLTSTLLNFFSPRDRHQHEKFPAYYEWCRGPTHKQMQRFTDMGYEIVEYHGFFGHSGYYKRVPILKTLHALKTHYLLKNPHPALTSYAYVVLKKAAH